MIGGFGGRLSRRLAARGHRVLVAGRSLARAQAFAETLPDAVGIAADRTSDLAPVLAEHRPDLVVDAAGPFDADRYAVPRACIAAGIPYADLADGRAFAAGVSALDGAASIAVIAGASSVPALSGAVVRRLARGLARVEEVAISISASNRATAGPSVAASILSYAGRPLRLWRGGRWTEATGLTGLRRESYRVPGHPPLRNRLVARADVPDLDLLASRLPGRPAVAFRAGTEFAWQTLGLWLAGFPVRWGLLRSARAFGPLASLLQRATARLGGDRSAMKVRVVGHDEAGPVEREWTLIADRGDGPEIPTLAAVLVAERALARAVPPGARDAGELLDLADFAPLFAELAVATHEAERRLPPPLYARVMGDVFACRPPVVRALHGVAADIGWSGEATVTRGRHPLARLVVGAMRLPPAGAYPLHVHLQATPNGGERWTRRFADRAFASRFAQAGPHLVERFGPLRFHFGLAAEAEGLRMRFARWSFLGVPLPIALGPRVDAREWQENDMFRLHVAVSLPLIGPVVGYDGRLAPSPGQGSERTDILGVDGGRPDSASSADRRTSW